MSKNKNVTPETKLRLVEKYLNGEISKSQAAIMANVEKASFGRWVSLYEIEGPNGLLVKSKNTVYSRELKLAAINSYLSGEGSLRDISQRYKLRSETQLHTWIKLYNNHENLKSGGGGGSYMKKSRNTTVDERVTIVHDCLANAKNYALMAKKYNVSYQQVRNWVKKYEEMGSVGLEDRRGRRSGTQPSRTPEEEMRDKIAQLEREKRDLQMENDLLKKVRELEGRDRFH